LTVERERQAIIGGSNPEGFAGRQIEAPLNPEPKAAVSRCGLSSSAEQLKAASLRVAIFPWLAFVVGS
jgi:hypothetical protein